ncbi:MAG: hypothetical protein KDK70_22930 [Myxococcales bacterium]|nr:hypothetical protein [Myxococcales bacterium]
MKIGPLASLSLALACLAGCPIEPSGGETGDDGIDITLMTSTTDAPMPPAGGGSSAGDGGSTAADPTADPTVDPTANPPDGTGSTGDSTSDDSSSSSGDVPDVPVDCGGTTYACTDGVDNDGDGLVDLDDPECIGPCDDDEQTFQTGIPGDNMDCKQDCFFDGNSGGGDDGCNWNLRCDPANPGALIGCEYTGGNNCQNQDPPTPECLMACQPLVPPGCDCFGCCTIFTDMGEVNIFLNSGPDCALDNLAACQDCTPQADLCGNPCEPNDCELCFGQTDLPEGCNEQQCDVGVPCEAHADCSAGEFCYLGCCYPEPPG